jgi:nicotinic acid mononucleotide adenylyltransferase
MNVIWVDNSFFHLASPIEQIHNTTSIRVHTCTSTNDALQKTAELNPTLVITNLRRTRADSGYILVEKLRSNNYYGKILVFGTSAMRDPNVQRTFLQKGADAIIETSSAIVEYIMKFATMTYYTPLAKLYNNLNKCLVEEEQGNVTYQKLFVLIATGALSPVHRMHVEMIRIAKDYLEKNGAKVIAGYISPSHDLYVKGKLRDQFITGDHRINMCKAATASSTWLDADMWECKQPSFVSFSKVSNHVAELLRDQKDPLLQANIHRIQVAFVCGGDLVQRASMYGFSKLLVRTVIAVGRPQALKKVVSVVVDEHLKYGVNLHFPQDELTAELSSTDVRKCIIALRNKNFITKLGRDAQLIRESLEKMCHEDVVEYITKYLILN